ncbi:META domain-containing protein [Deinococcus sp. HMF7604]|uniref:META domain-containing protein n=1 Tax=Deinococcus betulae TaxID=2873312 RepID=UPI001CCF4424|nr:META domain-containing protein [Deinococcus betulae]MBZ9751424.1 META domain-containing protein [Deinococcus betulae]
MRVFLNLALLTAFSAASAAVPAPLNGIWKLTGFTVNGKAVKAPEPTLVIVGNRVSGRLGCGSYQGTISAGNNAVKVQVVPDPPPANVKCLYALPGDYHGALNAATGYAITQDTQQLVLFSKTGRLTFQRIGYVTPAGK